MFIVIDLSFDDKRLYTGDTYGPFSTMELANECQERMILNKWHDSHPNEQVPAFDDVDAFEQWKTKILEDYENEDDENHQIFSIIHVANKQDVLPEREYLWLHPAFDEEDANVYDSSPDEESPFYCEQCQVSFRTKSYLEGHQPQCNIRTRVMDESKLRRPSASKKKIVKRIPWWVKKRFGLRNCRK